MVCYDIFKVLKRIKSMVCVPGDFLKDRTHCCQEAGKLDSHCIPISVPKDDPYLKVTDIRCLNFSRAKTFQESGCTPEIIPSEQVRNFANLPYKVYDTCENDLTLK